MPEPAAWAIVEDLGPVVWLAALLAGWGLVAWLMVGFAMAGATGDA